MTERLYYTDAYRQQCESIVISCAPAAPHFEVVLAATTFYPTSGGQPHDVGTLGRRRVLDVVDRDDAIAHVVDGPLEVGASVVGTIDWPRRFDHMQQHTGQHILSAAFEAVCHARTESVHLGATTATLDLHRVVSLPEIAAAEGEANRVVWQNRDVRVRVVPADEAATLPLRKESYRTGPLRLVEVADFDLSACGGTHVARTGGVGVIAVTGSEKFKGGTRVEFRCGGRVLTCLHEWRDAYAATSRVLSVSAKELAPAIERLQTDNKALGRSVRGLQQQLAGHVAAELVAAGVSAHGRTVVATALDGWDAAGLKAIATAIVATPKTSAAVFSTSQPALAVIARSADESVDVAAVLKSLVTRYGGKGGGSADLAQGGGLSGDLEIIVGAARTLLVEGMPTP